MNKELERLIMSAGDLPTIPVVATKVMQLMQEENATADDLARVVASDPAVAARVLKISNSSFYGCQRQIQTLPHAVMMLGFVTLKSVVIAASAKQVYHPFGLTEKLLWEHSFGAGLAARIIATETLMVNPDEAFLGGLFHDLGKQIMNFIDKERFQEAMQRCYNEGSSFEEVERQLFPYTHEEVGALVIRKWNFPDNLVQAVMSHHTLEIPDDEDTCLVNLIHIVSLADLFCRRFGVGAIHEQSDLVIIGSRPVRQLGMSDEQVNGMLTHFIETFRKDNNYFL